MQVWKRDGVAKTTLTCLVQKQLGADSYGITSSRGSKDSPILSQLKLLVSSLHSLPHFSHLRSNYTVWETQEYGFSLLPFPVVHHPDMLLFDKRVKLTICVPRSHEGAMRLSRGMFPPLSQCFHCTQQPHSLHQWGPPWVHHHLRLEDVRARYSFAISSVIRPLSLNLKCQESQGPC